MQSFCLALLISIRSRARRPAFPNSGPPFWPRVIVRNAWALKLAREPSKRLILLCFRTVPRALHQTPKRTARWVTWGGGLRARGSAARSASRAPELKPWRSGRRLNDSALLCARPARIVSSRRRPVPLAFCVSDRSVSCHRLPPPPPFAARVRCLGSAK